LCGDDRISSLVRWVTSEPSSCGSSRKPLCSRSGIGTGRAPEKAVIDSYIGNPGSGRMTSSPSSHSARMVKNMIGLAPGVTTTRAGSVRKQVTLHDAA
jgi:hypothetical protein